jgi:glutamine phosphoribosylpyrophosphate amidotransferase
MCGVAGVSLDNPSDQQREIVRNVLIETEIRGKHASGIAWFDGNKLNCTKESVPISDLLKTFDLDKILSMEKVRFVSHIRYSTSDLLFNQPIGNSDFYICHNGVVTQSEPEEWESKYGYKCAGRNDSELIFHHLGSMSSESLEEKFPRISYALVWIYKDGFIHYRRNSLRPLWKATFENGYIVSSTFDILKRAGVEEAIITKVSSEDGLDEQTRTNKMKRTLYGF